MRQRATNTSPPAVATTDQCAQQIRMRRIVTTREGFILRQFALNQVELCLRNDCRHCRHWNPFRWRHQCTAVMRSADRMRCRAPDTGRTIPHAASIDLAGISGIGQDSADGG